MGSDQGGESGIIPHDSRHYCLLSRQFESVYERLATEDWLLRNSAVGLSKQPRCKSSGCKSKPIIQQVNCTGQIILQILWSKDF